MKKFLTIILASLVLTCGAACGTETTEVSSTSNDTTVSEKAPVSEVESEVESEVAETDEESEVASSDEEAEIDVSDMSNPFTMKKFAIDLPADFSVEDPESSIPIAYHSTYPERVDNYTFSTAGSKQNISDYSRKALEELYGTLFENFDGVSVYEETTCGDFDALFVEYNLEYSGVSMIQKQFYVFTDDELYIVTYTSETSDYDADFDAAIQSIKVQ